MRENAGAPKRPATLTMAFVDQRLTEIMKIEGAQERGPQLEQFARELGCSTFAAYESTWLDKEPLFIERILKLTHLHQEAEIARSARRSATAAVISATIALVAVIVHIVLA